MNLIIKLFSPFFFLEKFNSQEKLFFLISLTNLQTFKVSLTDSDGTTYEKYNHNEDDGRMQFRPLPIKKKIYEFYTAPITKFWADSVNNKLVEKRPLYGKINIYLLIITLYVTKISDRLSYLPHFLHIHGSC
jgi:hypothetical protein